MARSMSELKKIGALLVSLVIDTNLEVCIYEERDRICVQVRSAGSATRYMGKTLRKALERAARAAREASGMT